MADNVRMVVQGTHFYDGTVNVSWPLGEDAVRQVVAAPPAGRSSQLRNAILNGAVEETADAVTPEPEAPEPSSVVRMVGAPDDGQVPAWDESSGTYVPATPGGAVDGISDVPGLEAALAALTASVEDVEEGTAQRVISVIIDGGGAPITAGIKAGVEVPFAWTDIASWRVLSIDNTSGSIVVDVKKATYANAPGTFASISASAKPTLSSAVKNQDTTLTGWTKTGAAGDILQFVVEATPATVQLVLVSLVLVV